MNLPSIELINIDHDKRTEPIRIHSQITHLHYSELHTTIKHKTSSLCYTHHHGSHSSLINTNYYRFIKL
jgi:hypothetical protein